MKRHKNEEKQLLGINSIGPTTNIFNLEPVKGTRLAPARKLDRQKHYKHGSINIYQSPVHSEFYADLIPLMDELENQLEKVGFVSNLTEYSHRAIEGHHTDDQIFLAIVKATKRLFQTFINVAENSTSPSPAHHRGPIVPSPGLYRRYYWHSRVTETISSQDAPEDLDETRIVQHYTYPIYPTSSDRLTIEPTDIEKYICGLHYDLLNQLTDDYRPLFSDLLIIPIRWYKETPCGDEICVSIQPGGAIFAFGQFDSSIQDNLSKIQQSIESFSFDIDAASRVELIRLAEEGQRIKTEMQKELLRRGAIHEVRHFASNIRSLVRSCDDQMDNDLRDRILGNTSTITIITSALTRGANVYRPPSMMKVFQAATSMIKHTCFSSGWAAIGQDIEGIHSFLETWSGDYTNFNQVLQAIEADPDFGKAVVAMRNLIDNAINGCGDQYTTDGKLLTIDADYQHIQRPFDIKVYEENEQFAIENTAILPDLTYRMSYTWTNGTPIGFYKPERLKIQRPNNIVEKELALRGGRLAQIIFDLLGYQIELEPRKNGTKTVATRTVISPQIERRRFSGTTATE